MLAMQYSFEFPDEFDMASLRRRVEDKGPLFDDYPGLAQKAFMINEGEAEVLGDRIGNEYATFYLWEDDAAARAFLESEAFAAVTEAFGRPRVRLWQVLSFKRTGGLRPRLAVQESMPIQAGERLADIRRQEEQTGNDWLNSRGFHSQIVGLDPHRWELVRFSLWADLRAAALPLSGEARTFEVLHLSAPVHEPELEDFAVGLRPAEPVGRPVRPVASRLI